MAAKLCFLVWIIVVCG